MLDGKYEITSERELDARTTLFAATAPDGTALQISWYELSSAEEERAFEAYRTLLRQLRREGHAAIYDLVARPGAHYVAWQVPEALTPPDPARLGEIETLLATHGRTLGEAQIGSSPPQAEAKVFALPFSRSVRDTTLSGAAPTGFPPPLTTQPRAVDNLWIRLWYAFRPWAVGVVLALVGVLLLLLSLERTLQSGLVSVPDVRGEPINEALATLRQMGFRSQAVPLASAHPPGTVIEVIPDVGTPLRPGRTLSVSYALSSGRAPSTVPPLTGKALGGADEALGRAGFSLGEVARAHHRAPAGTVIAQTPPAGSTAGQGSRVGLLLSSGPAPAQTFLPDLTGLKVSDALALAEAAGFARSTVALEQLPGSGAAAGTVLAQNITPFLSVPQAAQLRLTVASSRAPSSRDGGTPDLIGLDLAEAQRLARSVGLGVVEKARVRTPLLPSGVVLQAPAPGAPPQGDITVTLNEGAEPVAPSRPQTVRRAEYLWLLGPEAQGKGATVSVTVKGASGATETEVLLRDQRVATRQLGGVYLTTARGPLTFRLSLDGEPYARPLIVDP